MALKVEQEIQNREKNFDSAADFISSVLLILFSVFVLVESLRMPLRGGRIIISPGLLPTVMGAILMILSVMLLVSAVKKRGHGFVKSWVAVTLKDVEFKRWLAIASITGVYIFFIGRVPFYLATFVYFIGIFLYLKSTGKYWTMVLIALAATVFTSYIIPEAFGMPLPN